MGLPAADTAHDRVKLQPPIPFYGAHRHYATVSLERYFRVCTSRCCIGNGLTGMHLNGYNLVMFLAASITVQSKLRKLQKKH